jgi:hypothetical protein
MDRTETKREARSMETKSQRGRWTIVEISSGEAVTGSDRIDTGDPVLFDTEIEAADWAVSVGLDPTEHSIVEVGTL